MNRESDEEYSEEEDSPGQDDGYKQYRLKVVSTSVPLNCCVIINPGRIRKHRITETRCALAQNLRGMKILVKVIDSADCKDDVVIVPKLLQHSLDVAEGDFLFILAYGEPKRADKISIVPLFDPGTRDYSQLLTAYFASDRRPVSIGAAFSILEKDTVLKFRVVNMLPTNWLIATKDTKVYMCRRSAAPENSTILNHHIEHLALAPSVVDGINKFVGLPIQHPTLLKSLGISGSNGVLVYGGKGSGKSALLTSLPREYKVSAVFVQVSEIMDLPPDKAVEKLGDCFAAVLKRESALLLLDDVSGLAKDVRGHKSVNERRLAATFVSGLDLCFEKGVKVIATANDPSEVDSCLQRLGRFAYQVPIPIPNEAQRKEIIGLNTKQINLSGDDLATVSRAMDGRSCAEIARITEVAVNRMVYRHRQGQSVFMTDMNIWEGSLDKMELTDFPIDLSTDKRKVSGKTAPVRQPDSENLEMGFGAFNVQTNPDVVQMKKQTTEAPPVIDVPDRSEKAESSAENMFGAWGSINVEESGQPEVQSKEQAKKEDAGVPKRPDSSDAEGLGHWDKVGREDSSAFVVSAPNQQVTPAKSGTEGQFAAQDPKPQQTEPQTEAIKDGFWLQGAKPQPAVPRAAPPNDPFTMGASKTHPSPQTNPIDDPFAMQGTKPQPQADPMDDPFSRQVAKPQISPESVSMGEQFTMQMPKPTQPKPQVGPMDDPFTMQVPKSQVPQSHSVPMDDPFSKQDKAPQPPLEVISKASQFTMQAAKPIPQAGSMDDPFAMRGVKTEHPHIPPHDGSSEMQGDQWTQSKNSAMADPFGRSASKPQQSPSNVMTDPFVTQDARTQQGSSRDAFWMGGSQPHQSPARSGSMDDPFSRQSVKPQISPEGVSKSDQFTMQEPKVTQPMPQIGPMDDPFAMQVPNSQIPQSHSVPMDDPFSKQDKKPQPPQTDPMNGPFGMKSDQQQRPIGPIDDLFASPASKQQQHTLQSSAIDDPFATRDAKVQQSGSRDAFWMGVTQPQQPNRQSDSVSLDASFGISSSKPQQTQPQGSISDSFWMGGTPQQKPTQTGPTSDPFVAQGSTSQQPGNTAAISDIFGVGMPQTRMTQGNVAEQPGRYGGMDQWGSSSQQTYSTGFPQDAPMSNRGYGQQMTQFPRQGKGNSGAQPLDPFATFAAPAFDSPASQVPQDMSGFQMQPGWSQNQQQMSFPGGTPYSATQTYQGRFPPQQGTSNARDIFGH